MIRKTILLHAAAVMIGAPAYGQVPPPPEFLGPRVLLEEPIVQERRPEKGDRGSVPLPFLAKDSRCFPDKSRFPDPNGVVWLDFSNAQEEAIPNPFDVRLSKERACLETALLFSGVVHGEETAAVVNGKALLQGERVADFNIAAVTKAGLLLEKNGVYLVLPLGRRVLVKERF